MTASAKHPKSSSSRTGRLTPPPRPRGGGGGDAPSSRRLRAALAVLALAVAALAVTAAPALAAPPSTTAPVVSNVGYTSAHVEGKVTTDGSLFNTTAWAFQYSTDDVNWTTGFSSGFGTNIEGPATGKEVEATIPLPKGGTEYFVRLVAQNGFFVPSPPEEAEAVSPGPDPSFTTLTVGPPSVISVDDASSVAYTTAHVTGEVERPANPASPGQGVDEAFDVDCHFQYVTDEAFQATGFEEPGSVPCVPNPVHAEGTSPVEADLSGLANDTTYHLRLFVSNASPTTDSEEAADTFTTLTVDPPSVVSVADATDVTPHTAIVEGVVERPSNADPAFNVECRFEYISDQQLTENEANSLPAFEGAASSPCAQSPVEAAGQTTVSAELGLDADTTYHYRLTAENQGGSDTMVATQTFTTPAPELPTITIKPIAGGTYTTAHVSGTLEVSGSDDRTIRPYFEVSSDGGASWDPFEAPTFSVGDADGQPYPVQHDYTGLQPNTTYTFRIAGTYSVLGLPEAEAFGEVSFSAEEAITTEPLAAPTAEDLEATGVTATSAHLSATVDPHAPGGPLSELGKQAFATHWEFVCTPECLNANGNPIQGTVRGEEGVQVIGGDAKRLEPDRHYEVSVVVKSEGGEETVGPVPFDTPLVEPSVSSAPGGSDGKGGWILQGVVNPNNSTLTDCHFEYGTTATYPNTYQAPCSPMPEGGVKPVTVEAHLEGLTPGVTYHFRLFATNGAGTASGSDGTFVPVGASGGESCPNEQIRAENNSLALPECRAYEMVTPPGKEGFPATFYAYDGGSRLAYQSGAGNIAKSGQNSALANSYVSARSATGWETLSALNGVSGSLFSAPSYVTTIGALPVAYSGDLLSSLWDINRRGGPAGNNLYRRDPDGMFTQTGGEPLYEVNIQGTSTDLSHVLLGPYPSATPYGPGVYDVLGVGDDQTRRVDVDNAGNPVSACTVTLQDRSEVNAFARSISRDGRVIVASVVGGCGGPNPASEELWARIGDTTSVDVSASHCTRTAGDPGGLCNGPVGGANCRTTPNGIEVGTGCRGATFAGAALDGSRVIFTTTQQLVDEDTDNGDDIYACDISAGVPQPVGRANPCSGFMRISVPESGAAEVENVLLVSGDGSTILFTAKGILASNDDALGEGAVAGDHNLYVWRQGSGHPNGHSTFVGRLESGDVQGAQSTPDGNSLVFTTASPLVRTDTDEARDVYRYDAVTGELTRISTNVSGVGGNGGLDASITPATERNSHPAISDDGKKVVFVTAEALSPADGNAEPDAYLWTPTRISLISSGAAGGGVVNGNVGDSVVVDASGKDIYFNTAAALTPADGDDIGDVYDARAGGGFSFAAVASCLGESCQPPASAPPVTSNPTTSGPPAEPGNVMPKTCPKGKVAKGKKCVKKQTKKHKAKHHRKKNHHKHRGKNKSGHGKGGGR